MIVAGIDPGLNKTGVGIVEIKGNDIKYVDHFLIKNNIKKNNLDKLSFIYNELKVYLEKFNISYAAIEDIFYAKNVRSAILLGQVRGIIIGCLASLKISINEFTALQIKKAIVGYGRAEKEQVKKLILWQLNLHQKEMLMPDDCSDALACALCLSYNLQRENVLQGKRNALRKNTE